MLTDPRPLVATIYNPHNQSKEALIAGFVARKAKFERLFRDIHDAPMTSPEQHYMIQGLRGMGKTTLLLRLAYEIEKTPELHERLIPVIFNEEEYGISSLADLWERTAQYLEEANPLFTGLQKEITALYGRSDYERQAIETIVATLQRHGKNMLLLIDNIGDLLKKLDVMEAKRLREVLLTTKEIRLIGATSVMLEQTQDYSKPFYEFFKVIHLEALSRQEAIDLFSKLGEVYHTDAVKQLIKQQPGRIEAIRRLTGGVIRTMVLLFEIMVEDNSGSVFKDLNVLLDRVTPLYKHRMDDLPTQQQKIVAALAQAWDAASAKELAQAVRLESKVVSAQLKQLINNGLVEKVETNTKNHLYRLEERFFNIWYLMRFGRKTDQRVLWLVKFFELMFDGAEEWLKEKVEGHIRAMDEGKVEEETALYLTTAYGDVIKNEEIENILKRKTRKYLIMSGRSDLANNIKYSKYEEITQLINQEEYQAAINKITKLNTRYNTYFLDLASCYLLMGENVKASQLLQEIIVKDNIKNIFFTHYQSLKEKYPNQKQFICNVAGLVIYAQYKISLNKEEIILDVSASDMASEICLHYFYNISNSRKLLAKKISNKISVWDLEWTMGFTEEVIVKDIIKLWNNDFNSLSNKLIEFLITKDVGYDLSFDHSDFLGNDYLKLLLAKKQYHTAYNYFQQGEWQLKDRYKPLYYATLHFLRDEYPIDYLRMGPELQETVNDVLAEVEQMAIDYA